MYVVHGLLERHERIFVAQPLWHGLGDMFLGCSPRIADDLEESFGAECRCYLLGRGVDALHGKAVGAAQGLLDEFKLGVSELHLIAKE